MLIALPTAALVFAASPVQAVEGGSASACGNASVRTQQQSAFLTDCRAYELVSPVEKHGGVPSFPPLRTSLAEGITAAATAGDELVWFSATPAGDATNGLFQSFLSKRTASGWSTAQALPDPLRPQPSLLTSLGQVVDVTDDLSTRFSTSTQPYGHFDPLHLPLRTDLYRQDGNGAPNWLSRPNTDPPADFQFVSYRARTPDGRHVLFGSREVMDPAAATQTEQSLYVNADGHSTLVAVDSAGTAIGNCGSILGGGVNADTAQHQGAVSPDGNRIFFSVPYPFAFSDPSCADPEALYVRDGSSTTKVSTPRRPVNGPDPGGTQPAYFQVAADDGSVVYFTSTEALTDDATPDPDLGARRLYRYDVPIDQLSLVGPTGIDEIGVSAVVAASADARRVYFVSYDTSGFGAGQDGQPNLYVDDAGTTRFVATIDQDSLGNSAGWEVTDFNRASVARVSPDGDRFVFPTTEKLTAYDNAGHVELYEFDVTQPDGAAVRCVSCRPDGRPPIGDAKLTHANGSQFDMRSQLPRSFADDGGIFFDTDDALVPTDDNGVTDAYEWSDGAPHLISTGRNAEPSYFVDSTRGGRDAFFVTSEPLVGTDGDHGPDVYVARSDGGFPEAAPAAAPCREDTCQPPSPPGPVSQTPGSVTAAGANAPARTPRPAAPKATLTTISASTRKMLARRGTATVTVRVTAAGTVSVRGRATVQHHTRDVVVARGRARAAGSMKVQLKLSTAARRELARRHTLKVSLRISLTGQRTPQTVTFTLTNGGR